MKKTTIFLSFLILTMLASIEGQAQATKETVPDNSISKPNISTMKSYISIFEIPATDIDRAVNFYQVILDIQIEKMEFEGMKMGVLPYENQVVTGVIVEGEGSVPSASGVTLYLNGGENLQVVLDKVESAGGQVIMPKTMHADESGFFALFIDSEGNKIGLHSVN